MMFGFLNIDKPAGPTSHDIVATVRRLVGRKVKVGHAGTLDPFATGVLVVCLGPATRLADYVQAAPKRYRTDIHLGATSTTDDCDGEITPRDDATPPPAHAVTAACATFIGNSQQTPPAHSAVHVDGERAYVLARAGEHVELRPRNVTIYDVHLLDYSWPRLTLEITCGSGTYIRAIARDLGAALGVGGYCQTLRRLAVGAFDADGAISPSELAMPLRVADPSLAVAGWNTYVITDALMVDLHHGHPLEVAALISRQPAHTALPSTHIPPDWAALVSDEGALLALAERKGTTHLQPRKVLCPRPGQ